MTDSRDESFNVAQYLQPLARHKSVIVTFCLSATLSSLLMTYMVSEKYRATTTILYQPREAVSFQPKVRDALGFPMPLVALESIGNTLEEVVKSDAIIEAAVRKLNLDVPEKKPASNFLVAAYRITKDKIKEYRDDALQLLQYGRILPKDPFAQAMINLRQNLSIKRTTKAYSLELEALDSDPQRAARTVDTVAGLLSEFLTKEQAQVASEAREKIEPRLKQSSDEIAALRAEIETVKTQSRVSSLTEELSLKVKTVSSLEEDLTKAHNDIRSLENKRAELNAQLAQQQPSVKYTSTTTTNPVVDDMKLELARLEVERSGLLEKFTPNHPVVRTVDAKLQQVRDKLSREEATLVSSQSVRVNDLYQSVLSQKLSNDAEIQTLKAKELALREALDREAAAAHKLTEKEPHLAELALKLKAAEQSYEMISSAYEEARLAEFKTASEVASLHPALVPTAPARPIKILYVGVTFVLSLLLSAGFVFFLNFFDSTLRDVSQVERIMQLPVFATIPAVKDAEPQTEKLLLELPR